MSENKDRRYGPKQELIHAARSGRPKVVDPTELGNMLYGIQCQLLGLLGSTDLSQVEIKTSNDVYKLSTAAAALSRAQIEYEKWQCERSALTEEAVHLVQSRLRAELVDKPELVAALLEMLDAKRLTEP